MIQTIIDLIDSFEGDSRIAIIHNGTHITYEQFYDDITNLSAHLSNHYLRDGESALLYSKNKYKLLLGIYSVMYAGAVAVPVGDNMPNVALEKIANVTNSKIVLTDDIDSVLTTTLTKVQIKDFQQNSDRFKREIDEHDSALVLFTSGTSGEKKGTLLSHRNLIRTALYINEFMEVKQRITEYLMIPVFHSFGLGRTRCVFLVKGTLVLDDGLFNPFLMVKRLVKHNCDAFSGVPSVIAMLIKAGESKFSQFGKNIRFVEIGSAPMLTEHKEFLLNHLPHANICMHYGLTEASRSCFINFRKEHNKLCSVGKPSPGVRVMIVDDNSKELPAGELGEIIISGPNVSKGYLNKPSLNKEKFIDDWFHTGDLGHKDNEGYVYFSGRKDDIINVGGEKISPLEIEHLINSLNLINGDFCVVGIHDREGIYGQVPVLCVTDINYSKSDLENLNTRLWSSGLKKIFQPKFFYHMQQIPKTNNGKVMRREIGYLLNNYQRGG